MESVNSKPDYGYAMKTKNQQSANGEEDTFTRKKDTKEMLRQEARSCCERRRRKKSNKEIAVSMSK